MPPRSNLSPAFLANAAGLIVRQRNIAGLPGPTDHCLHAEIVYCSSTGVSGDAGTETDQTNT